MISINSDFESLLKEVKRVVSESKRSDRPFDYRGGNFSRQATKLFDKIENSNYSYAVNLILSKMNSLNDVAIRYRGMNYTYKMWFATSYKLARAMKKYGVKIVPACSTNTPEFDFLFLACSMMGVKIDSMGDWFNKDYMSERIKSTNSNIFFTDDLTYKNIKDVLEKSDVDTIVMSSITDSLPTDQNGKKVNPYDSIEGKFHKFENNIPKYKSESKKKIVNLYDFMDSGMDYKGDVLAKTDLNDVMTTTYTSGTTDPGRPKPVNQTIRSYVTYAFGMQKSIPKLFSLKGLTYMNNIPPDTHVTLSMVSALAYQGATIVPEPFYSVEFFPYAVLINNCNIVTNSNPEFENLCNLLENDPAWKNADLHNLAFAIVTGEGTSKGQEKYYNEVARKHKFGTNVYKYPVTPTKFSIGGGTTEGTGVLITPYKKLLEELDPRYSLRNKNMGLKPMLVASFKVIDKDGNYLKPGKQGLVVEDSPCIMDGYDNPKLDNGFIYKDGRKLLSTSTYGTVDAAGSVYLKGRMNNFEYLPDGSEYQYYLVGDTIEKDTKNIKCALITYDNDKIVAHYKLQNNPKMSLNNILKSIVLRIESEVPEEIYDKLYLRKFDKYPVEPSGKISLEALKKDDTNLISFRNLQKVYGKKYPSKRLVKKYKHN